MSPGRSRVFKAHQPHRNNRVQQQKVQQRDRTSPTAANLYRLHHERKDLQRPCCHKLRIRGPLKIFNA